jgi:hypothetical protein
VKKVLSWTVPIDQPNTHIFLFDSYYPTIISTSITQKTLANICCDDRPYLLMLEGYLHRNIQAHPPPVLQWVSIETSNRLGPKLLGISLLLMKEGANTNE